MTLGERFEALDDNLKLDPMARLRAERAHRRLGDLLVKAGIAKRTRLQGSFARKTMLPPLHDIDKVVELSDKLRGVLADPDGPERAMRLMQEALAPHLPGAQFEIKKHALAISLPGDGFDFDAVPAFNAEDGSGWIVIADTKDHAWEPSNTYELIDCIANRNQDCDGKFVRQVRMVKQVVFTAGLGDLLPGLHQESFAHEVITEAVPHPDAVAATLAAGARMLGGSYTDPTGADRISDRLEPAVRAAAQQAMTRLAARAAEAQRLAAAGDETAAARIWGELFGDPFPAPPPDEAAFLRRLHAGAPIAAAAPRTTRTRAWRPE